MLWCVFTVYHCIPLMREPDTAQQGMWQAIVFNVLAFMLAFCYVRCVLTHPGMIPDKAEPGQMDWEYVPLDARSDDSPNLDLLETKRSGDRRHCKWCAKYKPDRCHHCRVCKCCILKMDHHCPWIMNCVGFRNHKFFFLLVIYAVLSCLFISTTVFASISRSIQQEVTMTRRFLLVLCLVTSTILGILLAAFLTFHTMLMLRGMTTIEFCEKATMASTGTKSSAYDLGRYQNIKAAFGKNPYLWLLPVMTVEGDGMCFEDKTCENASKQIPATESADPEWTGHRDSPPAPEKAHLMDS